eukprot:2747004-Lingulodinium_polyedra.AAC.1
MATGSDGPGAPAAQQPMVLAPAELFTDPVLAQHLNAFARLLEDRLSTASVTLAAEVSEFRGRFADAEVDVRSRAEAAARILT